MSDVGAEGSENIGRRHWGAHALARCTAAQCAEQMRALAEQREPDVVQGALLLASDLVCFCSDSVMHHNMCNCHNIEQPGTADAVEASPLQLLFTSRQERWIRTQRQTSHSCRSALRIWPLSCGAAWRPPAQAMMCRSAEHIMLWCLHCLGIQLHVL